MKPEAFIYASFVLHRVESPVICALIFPALRYSATKIYARLKMKRDGHQGYEWLTISFT